MPNTGKRPAGLAVDSAGEIAYDPSANVFAWVKTVVSRLDDLREASEKVLGAELAGLRREVSNQVKYNEATRAHDLLAQRTADERHQAAVLQLSKSIESTAETLRRAVSETASNLAAQHSSTFDRLAVRLSEVEKNQYTDQGKQRVSDPQVAELLTAVKALQLATSAGAGKGAGAMQLWAILGGAIILAITIAKFFGH